MRMTFVGRPEASVLANSSPISSIRTALVSGRRPSAVAKVARNSFRLSDISHAVPAYLAHAHSSIFRCTIRIACVEGERVTSTRWWLGESVTAWCARLGGDEHLVETAQHPGALVCLTACLREVGRVLRARVTFSSISATRRVGSSSTGCARACSSIRALPILRMDGGERFERQARARRSGSECR